ncbi:hypothetical protein C5167_048323 [Papaver somniferum]|uniref:Uncharacterized protein n=1 Tax=Papaver somniferum TaxID=3469 RepID=A0A4Y7KHM8_PAPSO|nr:hypothetical protein C5167_048323 [Papaver somniferum]
MGIEENKDLLKGVDWKNVGGDVTDASSAATPVIKKRLPKKVRQVPEYYFLPRRPLSVILPFYGACIAAGIGTGMLIEVWINKKIKEDGGGVLWKME